MSRFAERLNHLFETVHPASRGPYTLTEVAHAINDAGKASISIAYLSQLRKGARSIPNVEVTHAIANFFGVDPRYFTDDEVAQAVDQDLDLLTALRDSPVRRIATRSFDLSPSSKQAVEDLIESLHEVEKNRPLRQRRKRRRNDSNTDSGTT